MTPDINGILFLFLIVFGGALGWITGREPLKKCQKENDRLRKIINDSQVTENKLRNKAMELAIQQCAGISSDYKRVAQEIYDFISAKN